MVFASEMFGCESINVSWIVVTRVSMKARSLYEKINARVVGPKIGRQILLTVFLLLRTGCHAMAIDVDRGGWIVIWIHKYQCRHELIALSTSVVPAKIFAELYMLDITILGPLIIVNKPPNQTNNIWLFSIKVYSKWYICLPQNNNDEENDHQFVSHRAMSTVLFL